MTAWQRLVALLPFEWAQYAFMQHALLAVICSSLLFALLGALLVNQRMAFFSDAIGHSAFTGIALGVVLGLGDPLWAMATFAVLLAAAMTLLRRVTRASDDTVISIFMSFAVALGVVVLSRGGGFAKYSAYLIGDLLSVAPPDIARLAVLIVLTLAFYGALFNQTMFVSLNPSLAGSRRINVRLVELAFAVLVAVAVTVSIRLVGLLVVNALLVLPAATARNAAGNVARYVGTAVLVSLASGVAGLIASYFWATATGATIVLFAMACYLSSLLRRKP
ncbi:MAG: metal ABC transporter permease [Candidatus Edwardsbacteria bacterium]|jgi:zinc transport system permease protein|nr:metal ABC transporter permease [Candidatus Edwardsbacteria bacterium]